jgi:hypothetical protein
VCAITFVKEVYMVFPGGKTAGGGVDHPHPSRAKVKEILQLNFYSPFGPSWPILGRNLPLAHKFPLVILVQSRKRIHATVQMEKFRVQTSLFLVIFYKKCPRSTFIPLSKTWSVPSATGRWSPNFLTLSF